MIINFGSVNIDHVYRVAHMPAPGETLAVRSYERFLGGKGVNQSIAVARSGGEVKHVGAIGPDGQWAADGMRAFGVDPVHLAEVPEPTGHAVIMVDDTGENQILICGGANRCLTTDQIARHLGDAGQGHWVLLQNETNLADEIVRRAGANGFQVAYSAAPFAAADALPLLEDIDLLCLNHIEAAALAEACGVPETDIPVPRILITRGGQGAEYRAGGTVFEQAAFEVTPVDTTGAGDTFFGAFLARLSEGSQAPCALRYAAAASAIQVTRPGAAAAIPNAQEVAEFMNRQDA